MPCYPLNEDTYTVDNSKTFVPFDKQKDKLELRPQGSLLVEIVPFLIVTKNDVIVIDPGLGYKADNGEYYIQRNLRYLGYSSDDVTIVLLSHLHKDHAGGACYNENGQWHFMFPKATYYMQQDEYADATGKDNASYETEKLHWLAAQPQCKMLHGDGHINNNIYYFITGGHTAAHQAFIINDDAGHTYLYGGDVLSQSGQLKTRYVAKYDYDGKRAAEWRKIWATEATEKNYIILFFHDTAISAGSVSFQNETYRVAPVQ